MLTKALEWLIIIVFVIFLLCLPVGIALEVLA